MTFTCLCPMLRTKDFEGTIEFYTRRLGFTCDGAVTPMVGRRCGGMPCGSWSRPPNAHSPFDTPAFTGSLYFNVDDAAALWETGEDRTTGLLSD